MLNDTFGGIVHQISEVSYGFPWILIPVVGYIFNYFLYVAKVRKNYHIIIITYYYYYVLLLLLLF